MGKIQANRNQSRKDVIRHTAARLFRERGYTAASMRMLADAVGVEAPSLYNHIGSKAQILQEICEEVANDFLVQIEQVTDSKGSATQQMAEVLHFHSNMMVQQYDAVYVANHEWKHLPEAAIARFLEQRRQYEKKLVAIVEAGIAQQELQPVNAYTAVLTMLAALRGLEFWQRHKKQVAAATLQADMVALLLNGIVKK